MIGQEKFRFGTAHFMGNEFDENRQPDAEELRRNGQPKIEI